MGAKQTTRRFTIFEPNSHFTMKALFFASFVFLASFSAKAQKPGSLDTAFRVRTNYGPNLPPEKAYMGPGGSIFLAIVGLLTNNPTPWIPSNPLVWMFRIEFGLPDKRIFNLFSAQIGRSSNLVRPFPSLLPLPHFPYK